MRAYQQPISPFSYYPQVGQNISRHVAYCVSPYGQKHLYGRFRASATHDIITNFLEVTSLLNNIRLPMYKWATNSTHFQDTWRMQGLPEQTETQVLGMDWETQSDTIHIEHTDITRHCRNDRQRRAKYCKSGQEFTTRSDCFRQWHS